MQIGVFANVNQAMTSPLPNNFAPKTVSSLRPRNASATPALRPLSGKKLELDTEDDEKDLNHAHR